MLTQQQRHGTDLSAIGSPTYPVLSAVVRTSGSRGSDLTRPTIAVCAILLGFVGALYLGGGPANVAAVDLLHWIFSSRAPEPGARQALVVMATRIDQLTVVATLSPRGFHPLLASTRREVLAQIRAYPGALSLAVVDDRLPDYAFIARVLKDNVPLGGIIVLKGSHRSQDIGPMLLDRL
jgi:hypothetical protein